MKKYILEIIVFIGGATVMILELVGSRILAPYVGTSIIVWTSLIGIILGSLSLGYYLGGKIADRRATHRILALILFSSAILITLTAIIKNPVLTFVGTYVFDLRTASILSTIILFTPASIALGMIAPYAIKLKLENLSSTGRTVGNLYAISTIGSIVGTFLAGFVLITFFGNTNLLLILSATLVLTSLLTTSNIKLKAGITAITVIGIIGFALQLNSEAEAIELNTTYSYIKIYDGILNSKEVKILKINNNFHSAMYLDSDELVFDYTKYYRLIDHFAPDLKTALMIGGGAYSYPKDFLASHPEATLDVVEIDAELTQLAKEHFGLKDDPRLTIYHEDGRPFLNRTENLYDAIMIDAFSSSLAVPYHLTTLENVQNLERALNDDGVVIMNLITEIEGEGGKFLRAEYHTYKEVFPVVHLFPVQFPESGNLRQNVMLVATKSQKTLESENEELNDYLKHLWKNEIPADVPILTDDFAPVDQYTLKMI